MSYLVVFTGKIKAGLDHDKVMNNLSLLFKKDIGFINRLFSGQHVIIKRDLDQKSAQKYKMALGNAGAICEVQESQTAPLTVARPGETIMEPAETAEAIIDTSTYSLAAAGATITETAPLKNAQINELQVDLSPPGAILNQDEPVKPIEIDVSNMSLENTGAGNNKV